MKKLLPLFSVLIFATAIIMAVPGSVMAGATVSAAEYEVGDTVTVEGTIEPGQDLYVAISQQAMFAPKDTTGPHEIKKLKKMGKKYGFAKDTKVPPIYYMLTTNTGKFGKKVDKRYGGPSFLPGIYKTTMFKLKKFDKLDTESVQMLGSVGTKAQWGFLRYTHEKKHGVNTITKERTKRGKILIFARSVLTDYGKTGNYWDKGTSIELDKATGKFKASFKTFRHSPPNTKFDVYVNGDKTGTFNLAPKGYWLSKGGRYMNPIWIILGAVIIGIWFSMMGAGGGMLMSAYQVMIVNTMGPIGINAANVLRPSNVGLTLFSPLGSFYRYAVVEKRIAWPIGLSFGTGIIIGSIWLGGYATQYLPMKSYKEWLAVLVVLMGIRLLYELTPKVMEKRKNIKAMVKKFNEEVAAAKKEGRSAEMGKIETVQTKITDYRFKFWGEDYRINALLFGFIGLGIGVVARSFGIGGGFLLVPIMTTLAALPMYVAVPIALVGTCFSSIGSFIGYIMNGYWPDFWIFTAIVIGAFAGGAVGGRLQRFFSEKQLKWALAILLFFLFFRFFKIEIWI
ncbi:MAG: sulfite exporter TauE/SafE family protein [Thermodesulfobacteriota bacterium]|nr:sulfite exporter TauE/SafE family protein [Thermodesulfobacteriota bacterium]